MMLFEMFNEQLMKEASEDVQRFILDVHGRKIGQIPLSCKVPMYLRNVIVKGFSPYPKLRPALSDYR